MLYCAVAAMLIGRAWQHIFWDAPYRSLLWDEELMAGALQSLGIIWEEYITNPETDLWIRKVIKSIGLYLLAAAAALYFIAKSKLARCLLGSSGILIFMLSLFYWKEHFYQVAQVMELAAQYCSPFILLAFLKNDYELSKQNDLFTRIAIALTFFGHGLYALGYYPIPVHFMSMTMEILGTNEEMSILFLKIAGVLDILVCIGLFLPKRWRKAALMYALIWGALTALARIFANVYLDYFSATVMQWGHETLMRFPNFLLPLFLLWVYDD